MVHRRGAEVAEKDSIYPTPQFAGLDKNTQAFGHKCSYSAEGDQTEINAEFEDMDTRMVSSRVVNLEDYFGGDKDS